MPPPGSPSTSSVAVDGAWRPGTAVRLTGTIDERYAARTIRVAAADIVDLGPAELPLAAAPRPGAIGEDLEGLRVTVAGDDAGLAHGVRRRAGHPRRRRQRPGPGHRRAGRARGRPRPGWNRRHRVTARSASATAPAAGPAAIGSSRRWPANWVACLCRRPAHRRRQARPRRRRRQPVRRAALRRRRRSAEPSRPNRPDPDPLAATRDRGRPIPDDRLGRDPRRRRDRGGWPSRDAARAGRSPTRRRVSRCASRTAWRTGSRNLVRASPGRPRPRTASWRCGRGSGTSPLSAATRCRSRSAIAGSELGEGTEGGSSSCPAPRSAPRTRSSR